MKRIALFVEGHGEVQAAANLVSRLADTCGHSLLATQVLRWVKLHRADGLERAVRYGERLGVDGLLLLRDEDDDRPSATGPRDADIVRGLAPRVPTAVVLMHREYEVVFLPSIHSLAGKRVAGRPGLLASARWTGDWESKRDVKGWLTSQMPPGRAYKPTLDQLPMTQMIDTEALLGAEVPCVGTLTRALRFLANSDAGVYPPASSR